MGVKKGGDIVGIYIPNIKKPINCHECDACGISDLVGIKCPDEYGFDNLPNDCPLEEVDDIAFGLYKAYIDGIGVERRSDE